MRSRYGSLLPFFLLAAMSGANNAQYEPIEAGKPVVSSPLRLKNIHENIRFCKRKKRRVRGKMKERYPDGVDF